MLLGNLHRQRELKNWAELRVPGTRLLLLIFLASQHLKMPPASRRLGIGAKVRVKAQNLEPSVTLRDRYGDDLKTSILSDIRVLRRERRVFHRNGLCDVVILAHESFTEELWTLLGHIQLQEPGPAEQYFV